MHVFLCYFCTFLSFFFLFSVSDRKRWKNLFSRRNKWFWPANGVQSIHSLVEIQNMWFKKGSTKDVILYPHTWTTHCWPHFDWTVEGQAKGVSVDLAYNPRVQANFLFLDLCLVGTLNWLRLKLNSEDSWYLIKL